MVWSNFQKFWLTALLLIVAVLQLVHGEYATCPTTIAGALVKKTDLQNAASYEEKRCTGGDKCCADRRSSFGVSIQVTCSASCTNTQVDCSEAANSCRNVTDVTGYYKSCAFITCPFYAPGELHNSLWGTGMISRESMEILCPATDACSLGRFIMSWDQYSVRFIPYLMCLNACKEIKADWMKRRTSRDKSIIYHCTACSSTEDCMLKLNKVPRCPTTKGRILHTKQAIEAAGSYEETICSDSDTCCARKTTKGPLAIEIKCSASCVSPQVDCSQDSNHCRDVADIRRHVNTDYVSCLSLNGSDVEWQVEDYWKIIIPKFENFGSVLCSKSEKCAAVRIEYAYSVFITDYTEYKRWSLAFAGCMTDCENFVRHHRYPNFCKECSTTDDCRKILQFNNTATLYIKRV